MTAVNYMLLYLLGFTPFLLLILFGTWIVWNDRKREKLEEEKFKKAKQH